MLISGTYFHTKVSPYVRRPRNIKGSVGRFERLKILDWKLWIWSIKSMHLMKHFLRCDLSLCSHSSILLLFVCMLLFLQVWVEICCVGGLLIRYLQIEDSTERSIEFLAELDQVKEKVRQLVHFRAHNTRWKNVSLPLSKLNVCHLSWRESTK